MKRWIAVCVVGLALVPCCRAQATGDVDAAKRAKVHELFTAMHMSRMMDQMMAAVSGMVDQMVDNVPGASQLTPAQKALVKELQAKAMKLATDSMGWQAMEPEYVKLYAQNFSDQELDAILVFYKSPAGQAMLDKTPELTKQSMSIVQARMVELQPKMKALQDEYMTKIQEAQTSPGKPASPAKH